MRKFECFKRRKRELVIIFERKIRILDFYVFACTIRCVGPTLFGYNPLTASQSDQIICPVQCYKFIWIYNSIQKLLLFGFRLLFSIFKLNWAIYFECSTHGEALTQKHKQNYSFWTLNFAYFYLLRSISDKKRKEKGQLA